MNDVNDARTTIANKGEDIYVLLLFIILLYCCLLFVGYMWWFKKKQKKSCISLSTTTPWREAQSCLYINKNHTRQSGAQSDDSKNNET